MKQKLLALVCALALVVSLAGCVISTPDTVGSLGDYEISSGLYLLAQYDAYQKAADLASSGQDAAHVEAFLKQTITVDSDSGETATVSDYVARKTLENLQTYAATELRFDELGGQLTAEEEQQADSYAQQLMDQYGDTYKADPRLWQRRRDPRLGRRPDGASGKQHGGTGLLRHPALQHQHLCLCG